MSARAATEPPRSRTRSVSKSPSAASGVEASSGRRAVGQRDFETGPKTLEGMFRFLGERRSSSIRCWIGCCDAGSVRGSALPRRSLRIRRGRVLTGQRPMTRVRPLSRRRPVPRRRPLTGRRAIAGRRAMAGRRTVTGRRAIAGRWTVAGRRERTGPARTARCRPHADHDHQDRAEKHQDDQQAQDRNQTRHESPNLLRRRASLVPVRTVREALL